MHVAGPKYLDFRVGFRAKPQRSAKNAKSEDPVKGLGVSPGRGYPVGYLGLEIPKKSFAFVKNNSIVANRRIGAIRRTGLPTLSTPLRCTVLFSKEVY